MTGASADAHSPSADVGSPPEVLPRASARLGESIRALAAMGVSFEEATAVMRSMAPAFRALHRSITVHWRHEWEAGECVLCGTSEGK